MKVRVEKTVIEEVEIGELDFKQVLPMASRRKLGMKSVCSACGNEITGDFFVAGIKKGFPNMMFHPECLENHGG